MRQSGATLREVGTTNRTRVTDYLGAVSSATALFLRVHPSNFRIEGFTERPALADLADAARAAGVTLVEDLGSGNLTTLQDEPSVQASIAARAALVWFSGDKLLGGPQAGIIAGRKALVDRLRTHPLMRALRADKMAFAALEATLVEYAAGREKQTIPVQHMLHMDADAIEARAQALAEVLAAAGWRVALMSAASAVGGGSAPGVQLPTVVLSIGRDNESPDHVERWLRSLDPPVIARIEHDHVVLDLRTVRPADDQTLVSLLTERR
jgi:L-seryl-tRNA(Ser) seleniumtransferase